ncbi:MAG: hypothetical protein ACLFPB_07015, partial [Desulfovermiculus sp.]
ISGDSICIWMTGKSAQCSGPPLAGLLSVISYQLFVISKKPPVLSSKKRIILHPKREILHSKTRSE